MEDLKLQTEIKTEGMAWSDRDLEVMLVFLKVLLVYAQDKKKLSTARWDIFFANIFKEDAKESNGKYSVWSLTDVKKYLCEEKDVVIKDSVKGKQYKLYSINPNRINEVVGILEANPRDNDETLMIDIEAFKKSDKGGKKGKFGDQRSAFDSLGFK